VAIQSFLKAGFLSAVQLELLFIIGRLQPVTNEIGAPSFTNAENDELVNAIRISRRREPRDSGTPVVANDVRRVDTERVKNAGHIADRVLKRISGHSVREVPRRTERSLSATRANAYSMAGGDPLSL
jgi:hypothetical protein